MCVFENPNGRPIKWWMQSACWTNQTQGTWLALDPRPDWYRLLFTDDCCECSSSDRVLVGWSIWLFITFRKGALLQSLSMRSQSKINSDHVQFESQACARTIPLGVLANRSEWQMIKFFVHRPFSASFQSVGLANSNWISLHSQNGKSIDWARLDESISWTIVMMVLELCVWKFNRKASTIERM